MMYSQQSLPPETFIYIHVNKVAEQRPNDSFIANFDKFQPKLETISVKSTDKISTIYKALNIPISNAKFFFNKKILCPNLSFAFYKINNKDTITVVFPNSNHNILSNFQKKEDNKIVIETPRAHQISRKRAIFYSRSSHRLRNDLGQDENQMKQINFETEMNQKFYDQSQKTNIWNSNLIALF